MSFEGEPDFYNDEHTRYEPAILLRTFSAQDETGRICRVQEWYKQRCCFFFCDPEEAEGLFYFRTEMGNEKIIRASEGVYNSFFFGHPVILTEITEQEGER